jgi:hypothetical protein
MSDVESVRTPFTMPRQRLNKTMDDDRLGAMDLEKKDLETEELSLDETMLI